MSATVDDPGPDTEPIRLGKVVDNPATRQTGAGDKSSSSDSSGSSSGSDGEDDAASISTAETVDQKSKPAVKLKVNKMVQWTGYNKRAAVLLLRPDGIIKKTAEHRALGDKYHMSFKLYKTECKLVRNTLQVHGFHEAHPNSNEFSLLWTGSHLKPYILRGLTEFQKVNHFPRSYEITRKDRLYRNVQRMQQIKGFKHFDFVPLSFVCPGEFQDFCSAFLREKGTWIVKPIASSRGRGIFLINHPDQLPLDETYIVSKYVPKPLLVDGFKFDLRLYVAVTSYDPLVIYLYEEGLSRFATVRYDQKITKNIKNQCMHLTNYSVNKKSGDFVQNEDPEVEDYGNKWSLGALLRCLRAEGHDTTAIMMRIEDAIIKTLISVETPIATACKMFMPFKGNCFELYGFDILIDTDLRPWVLEVNLSPSLACDSPMDLKIKSHVVADLFSVTGFVLHDPMLRTQSQTRRNADVQSKNPIRQQKQIRPGSGRLRGSSSGRGSAAGGDAGILPLSTEEARMVRRVKEEHARRGGWVRIFPTPESWDLYSNFLQYNSTNNQVLHQRLYPERYTSFAGSGKPPTANTAASARLRLNIHTMPSHSFVSNGSIEMEKFLTSGIQRAMLYERKLGAPMVPRRRKVRKAKPEPDQGDSDSEREGAAGKVLQQGEKQTDKAAVSSQEKTEAEIPTQANVSETLPENQGRQLQQNQNKNIASSVAKNSNKPVAMVEPVQHHRESREVDSASPPASPQQDEVSQPAEPPKEKPKFDLITELKRGCLLTKAQARFSFASYLTRVQYRLMSETSKNVGAEDLELANEQMDLVLRFLKRAAVNLSQPFKVVVPSRRLPVNDRRRILAKQLGDFVHIYSKETELLHSGNSRRDLQSIVSDKRINQSKLEQFISTAEEVELEQVLTTYTKINKSASIFLGNSKSDDSSAHSSSSRAASSTRPPAHHRSQQQSNMHGIIVNGTEGTSTWREEADSGRTSSATPSDPNDSMAYRSRNPSASAAAKSSFQNAVYIYSGKLAPSASPKQRPSSAVSATRTPASGPARSRPSSASLNRPQQQQIDLSSKLGDEQQVDGAFEVYKDMDNVSEALQQLTMRQQERNYYTSNVPSRQRASTSGGEKQARRESREAAIASKKAEENSEPRKQVSSTRLTERPSSASMSDKIRSRRNSAGETFDKFVGAGDSTSSPYQAELAADAYSKVTGVTPSGQFKPSRHSAQYSVLKQKQDKQEQLMMQSKALLEASKAKHQAMVAQAHAATKRVQSGNSSADEMGGATYAHPHPPKSPPNKPHTAHPHRVPNTRSKKSAAKSLDQGQLFLNVPCLSSSDEEEP